MRCGGSARRSVSRNRMLPARGYFVELDRASTDLVTRASRLIRDRGETVPGRAECQRIVTASR